MVKDLNLLSLVFVHLEINYDVDFISSQFARQVIGKRELAKVRQYMHFLVVEATCISRDGNIKIVSLFPISMKFYFLRN